MWGHGGDMLGRVDNSSESSDAWMIVMLLTQILPFNLLTPLNLPSLSEQKRTKRELWYTQIKLINQSRRHFCLFGEGCWLCLQQVANFSD